MKSWPLLIELSANSRAKLVRMLSIAKIGTLILLAGCLSDEPEFVSQAEAISRHGPTMKIILKKHPSQRIVVHYEPGWVVDRPHELIYDPTDHSVSVVIGLFKHRNPDLQECNITGEQVELGFFDLTVDCD